MELKCVQCGELEPVVIGVTVKNVRGKMEQACIMDFNIKKAQSNDATEKEWES
jgi:hypothetical protein